MAFYIRKSSNFMAFIYDIKLYIIKYIMSFKNITPEEYQRLINNKNRMFDLTFKTPEVLNKYRNDKEIYEEIKYSEKQNKKLKDYVKVFHENDDKKKIEKVSRYNYYIIKKKKKELEETNRELEDKDNKI